MSSNELSPCLHIQFMAASLTHVHTGSATTAALHQPTNSLTAATTSETLPVGAAFKFLNIFLPNL